MIHAVERIERDMKERRKTFDQVTELTNLVRNGEWRPGRTSSVLWTAPWTAPCAACERWTTVDDPDRGARRRPASALWDAVDDGRIVIARR